VINDTVDPAPLSYSNGQTIAGLKRLDVLRDRFERMLDRFTPFLMLLPAIVILAGLVLYPLVFNIDLSLYKVSILNIRAKAWQWQGLGNYLRVLTDPFTHASIIRTIIFVFASVAIQLVVGLGVALAFNVKFRGKVLLLALALIPMMVPPIAVGIAWRMLLSYDWGIVNYAISFVGIPPQQWLSNPYLAMVSVIALQVWYGVSFVMLVFLGGLAGLPRDPYEAAAIDGATSWQQFRHLTVPMLKPIILVLVSLKVVDALREFDLIYALTGGGPGTATRVFSLELYTVAYQRGDFGTSAAQTLLLLVIMLLLSIPLVRQLIGVPRR
jgi:multiple sugar transport system permease protein